jgi:hypothetical protein
LLEAARYNDMDDVASLTSNGFPIYNMFNLWQHVDFKGLNTMWWSVL